MADPRALLERAITTTGLSGREFAEQVVVRDERTVRRWRAGDVPIPDVVARRLAEIVERGGP